MDKFPKDFGGLTSADDFDLLTLGILPGEEPAPEKEAPEEEEPRINPLHDMDSLEFLLWAEEGAEQEIARRKAAEQAKAEQAKGAQPSKP